MFRERFHTGLFAKLRQTVVLGALVRTVRLVGERSRAISTKFPFDVVRDSLYGPSEMLAGVESVGYDATPDGYLFVDHEHGSLAGAEPESNSQVRRHHRSRWINAVVISKLWEKRADILWHGGMDGYADPAHLTRNPARAGLIVATEGGSGAIKAANLGAYFATSEKDALDEALMISALPLKKDRTAIGSTLP